MDAPKTPEPVKKVWDNTPVKFSPYTGRGLVQYADEAQLTALDLLQVFAHKPWRFNPWDGTERTGYDIEADPFCALVIPGDFTDAEATAAQRSIECPPDPAIVDRAVERDPHGIDQHAPGAKLDAGKVMPWLMISGFSRALAAVADVTTKGAIKYTPNGWASVPEGEHRYMEAFARHTLALGRGETIDADTGALHKAQMIWNLLASLELELRVAQQETP